MSPGGRQLKYRCLPLLPRVSEKRSGAFTTNSITTGVADDETEETDTEPTDTTATIVGTGEPGQVNLTSAR